jgi:hypothetical protein
MLHILMDFIKRIIHPPLRPKVQPGMWYFQTGYKDRVMTRAVVTLDENECQNINSSKDKNAAWLHVIAKSPAYVCWPVFYKNFSLPTNPQWFQVHFASEELLLKEANNGLDIRDLQKREQDFSDWWEPIKRKESKNTPEANL